MTLSIYQMCIMFMTNLAWRFVNVREIALLTFWLWFHFQGSISSLGRQDLVTQFLVKITFLYKLVAKKLDFVLSKLQISI